MAEKGLLTSPSGCRGDESPSRDHHFGQLRAGQREALSMGLETRYQGGPAVWHTEALTDCIIFARALEQGTDTYGLWPDKQGYSATRYSHHTYSISEYSMPI